MNVYYNSSWCLFKKQPEAEDEEGGSAALDYQDDEEEERVNQPDGDQEMESLDRPNNKDDRRRYRPYKFSGKTYSFDVNNERVILDELRNWANNYFSKEIVITG